MPTKLRELLLYFAASAAALALDTTVFGIALRLGMSLPIAACFGFSLGLMLIYTLSTRHVFAQHRLVDRRNEFILFALIGVAGMLLTQALLWLLVKRIGVSPIAGKLTSACAVFLFNFAMRKTLLFTARTTRLGTLQ